MKVYFTTKNNFIDWIIVEKTNKYTTRYGYKVFTPHSEKISVEEFESFESHLMETKDVINLTALIRGRIDFFNRPWCKNYFGAKQSIAMVTHLAKLEAALLEVQHAE